jgi:hypothetical protein
MSEKKKILGIGIDGVIRDMHNQFDRQYRKIFIKNESLVEMDENYDFAPSKEITDEDIKNIEKKINELINFPIDSFDLLNHYSFENKEAFDKFLYQDYAFQIFGSASQFPRAMDSVNFIQSFGEVNNLYETVLLSKEKDQGVMSTLHFLAKVGCKIKNIKFVPDHINKWDCADVIIDDCPIVFENVPKDKISIKINHMYNKWSEANYSFNSINEVNDKDFLLKIFGKK